MKRRVLLTGGGTAGHVNPNLALLDSLLARDCEVYYMGSMAGVERDMVTRASIPYIAIRTGKFRRYFSWQNFIDPFNVLMGLIQAYLSIRKLKPAVVFSKGGFVALPVVVAAWLNRVPVIAHESDFTPGLANRLSFPFLTKLCVTFGLSPLFHRYASKIEITGTPIREQLFHGSKARALALCGFDESIPCLLVMGGTTGARSINTAVRAALPMLTEHYQVIHLCGARQLELSLQSTARYFQMEYATDELADFLAASHMVISRSGANALLEILACGLPHLLVPLPLRVSRGDQIHNAAHFQALGVSVVVEDECLTTQTLRQAIDQIESQYDAIKTKIAALDIQSATIKIADLIAKIE